MTKNFELHCHGCILDTIDELWPRWESPSKLPSFEYISDLCVKMVSKLSRNKSKLVFPPLGLAFRTLFMDMTPRDTNKRLYSDLSNASLIARFFAGTILSKGSKEDGIERFKQLGFVPDDEKFEEFFLREFLPGTTCSDPSAFSFESIRMGGYLGHLLYSSTYLAAALGVMMQRIFYTSDGRVGLGPVHMEKDDIICVLNKCKVPVILRKAGSLYTFVGCAFVLGFMDGEAASWIQKGEKKLSQLVIR